MAENDYIAGNPLARDSSLLVVLSGCSGGGKSTLLNEMALRGYFVFPEPGRQIVKEEIFINGEALPWKDMSRFIDRCISRAIYFYNIANPSKIPTFFDRSIVDAISAFHTLYKPFPSTYKTILKKYKYHTTVFMVPPWEELFSHDSERLHSFSDAVAEYERLLKHYSQYGYETIIVPHGHVKERADFIETHLS
ncbi:AAA family ATPase [Desulfocicer niacini]